MTDLRKNFVHIERLAQLAEGIKKQLRSAILENDISAVNEIVAKLNNEAVIKAFDGAEIDVVNAYITDGLGKETALTLAISSEKPTIEIIDALLSVSTIDPNKPNQLGVAPIMLALRQEGQFIVDPDTAAIIAAKIAEHPKYDHFLAMESVEKYFDDRSAKAVPLDVVLIERLEKLGNDLAREEDGVDYAGALKALEALDGGHPK